MQKIILFEKDSETSSQMKAELLKAEAGSMVFEVNSSEQLISYIISGKFDSAIINYEQLGSLFRLKPYILRDISGYTKLYFYCPETTPMMILTFKMLRFSIFKKPAELNALLAEGQKSGYSYGG
ncbi:MAG: hypothetical protein IT279_08960 [Ignavibacteriaceae bacterium]|nr:hypothetical protein [Ignavibacteriaceae bacterium]